MKLYWSPLSSYVQKVLIALHEKKLSTERELVDLTDEDARRRYREVYPLGKVPLLVLDDGHRIPESSIIIEYLDTEFGSGTRLIPAEPTESRQTRFHDRMLDLYLNDSITTLLFESWKPEAARSAELCERARFRAGVIYDFMEARLADRSWLMGEDFTLADCAAAPPLAYARGLFPFTGRANIEAYWARLQRRDSWRAVWAEVEPHLGAVTAGARTAAG